jgi:SAM-dependent methyltransferase
MGTVPFSERWGHDRGLPICRYYLERFFDDQRRHIRGHCLEFMEDLYATRYGADRVTRVDILHRDPGNPQATIVCDLTQANPIASHLFDTIVCAHVLHVVFDLQAMIKELFRILKPGGVLLVAVPHVSMADPGLGELWRFTQAGLFRTLALFFGREYIETFAFGNSLTAARLIRGLVAEEFTSEELDTHDARFAVEICANAIKPS